MADFGVAATSLSKDALRNCNESMNRNRFHEKDRYRSMFCAITDTYKTKKESITRQHLTHTSFTSTLSFLSICFFKPFSHSIATTKKRVVVELQKMLKSLEKT